MERVLVSTRDGVPDLDTLDQRVGALVVEGWRGLDRIDQRVGALGSKGCGVSTSSANEAGTQAGVGGFPGGT